MIGVFISWLDNPKKGTAGWVIAENGCHLWAGSRGASGYGQVRAMGRAGGMQMIHRLRYEREVGPIPEGMELDHYVCNNGAGGCCNPRHCRPVTSWENKLRSDGFASHRKAQTHCKRGHLLAGDNLLTYHLNRFGWRQCRACHNAASNARYHGRRKAPPGRVA